MTDEIGLHNFHPLPERLLSGLGRVAAYYGQIEHLLVMSIRRTSEMEWQAAFDRVQQMRREDIRKEVRSKFGAWADQKFSAPEASARKSHFDNVLMDIAELFNARDDVTHCAWSLSTDGILTATRKGKPLKRDDRPMQIADVEALADALLNTLVALNRATWDEGSGLTVKVQPSGKVVVPLFALGTALSGDMAVPSTAANYTPDGPYVVFRMNPRKP